MLLEKGQLHHHHPFFRPVLMVLVQQFAPEICRTYVSSIRITKKGVWGEYTSACLCRGHGYRNEKYYNIKIKWHLRDEQKAKIS